MCFNHYTVTVAAADKLTSFFLFLGCDIYFHVPFPSFFLSLPSKQLLPCQVQIYYFSGKYCSQSEEYNFKEMKGDICWQFSTEL